MVKFVFFPLLLYGRKFEEHGEMENRRVCFEARRGAGFKVCGIELDFCGSLCMHACMDG